MRRGRRQLPALNERRDRHQDPEEVEDRRQIRAVQQLRHPQTRGRAQAPLVTREHQLGVDPHQHQAEDDAHEGRHVEEGLPDRHQHQRSDPEEEDRDTCRLR